MTYLDDGFTYLVSNIALFEMDMPAFFLVFFFGLTTIICSILIRYKF